MKSCKSCNCQIEDHLTLCPACGELMLSHESKGMRVQTHQLLADANVFRIQREFKQAINKCTEVMQLDPNNPEVHSLLGDIYADQGNLSEAARWYEIAIEMRPDCAIDINKLRDARARIAQGGTDDHFEATSSNPQPDLYNIADQRLKIFIMAGVVLVTILLTMGFGSWVSNPGLEEIPAPPSITDRSDAPVITGPSNQSTSDTVRPASEQRLVYDLATSPVVTALRIVVEDVRIDPRASSATITFWSTEQRRMPSHARIMADAQTVAKATFTADRTVRVVTTRVISQVRGDDGVERPHIALVCDFARPSGRAKPSPKSVWWGSATD